MKTPTICHNYRIYHKNRICMHARAYVHVVSWLGRVFMLSLWTIYTIFVDYLLYLPKKIEPQFLLASHTEGWLLDLEFDWRTLGRLTFGSSLLPSPNIPYIYIGYLGWWNNGLSPRPNPARRPDQTSLPPACPSYTCPNGPARQWARDLARSWPGTSTAPVPRPTRSDSRAELGLAVWPAVQARARHS
jgi:hypothetical protein